LRLTCKFDENLTGFLGWVVKWAEFRLIEPDAGAAALANVNCQAGHVNRSQCATAGRTIHGGGIKSA